METNVIHLPEQKYVDVSARYTPIDTMAVVNTFTERLGLKIPAKGGIQHTLSDAGTHHGRHLVRMRSDAPLIKGEAFPEVLLTNAYDGTTSFEISLGIFRLVCLNGLVTGDAFMEPVSIRHTKQAPALVEEAVEKVLGLVPELTAMLKQMQGHNLTRGQQLTMAEEMATARFGVNLPVQPVALLEARRPEDEGDSVWSVYNRVQEHLIVGGMEGRLANGHRHTTRPIRAISRNMTVNRALWNVAQRRAA